MLWHCRGVEHTPFGLCTEHVRGLIKNVVKMYSCVCMVVFFLFWSGIPIIMVAAIAALHQYEKLFFCSFCWSVRFIFFFVSMYTISIYTFEWFFNLLNGLFYYRNKENKNHLIGEKRLWKRSISRFVFFFIMVSVRAAAVTAPETATMCVPDGVKINEREKLARPLHNRWSDLSLSLSFSLIFCGRCVVLLLSPF